MPDYCPICGAEIDESCRIFASRGEYDDDSDRPRECHECGWVMIKDYQDGDIPF